MPSGGPKCPYCSLIRCYDVFDGKEQGDFYCCGDNALGILLSCLFTMLRSTEAIEDFWTGRCHYGTCNGMKNIPRDRFRRLALLSVFISDQRSWRAYLLRMVVSGIKYLTLRVCLRRSSTGRRSKVYRFKPGQCQESITGKAAIRKRKCSLLTMIQCFWVYQVAYVWTCMAARISITMTLLRIAVKRIHRIILWLVTSVTVLIGLASWIVIMVDCQPVSYFWDRNLEGHCLETNLASVTGYIYSIPVAMCDFTIGILPAFIIWNIQMDRQTKWGLIGILGLGCVYGIVYPLP